MKYAIVIEHVPGSNYSACVPDLPGCVTAGNTIKKTKKLMREAIEMRFKGMRANGPRLRQLKRPNSKSPTARNQREPRAETATVRR
jgi:predicted RNase H-like HicB family nuclease